MNTLHLTCPNCKNLMAVSTALLGKNVRCPHCRQVVQAPPPVAEAPVPDPPMIVPVEEKTTNLRANRPLSYDTDPIFSMPEEPKEAPDSIFGEAVDDDVFGSRPERPVMPPEEATELLSAPADRLQADFGVLNTVISLPPAPPEPEPKISPPPPKVSTPQPKVESFAHLGSDSESELAPPGSSRQVKKPQVRTGGGSNLFTWLLLFWAIAATGAAVYFATTKSYLHAFQAIPDVYGEYEKADRKKISAKLLPSDKLDVPVDLRIPLGGKLRMNDLEIEPIRVEAGAFRYVQQRGKEGPLTKNTPGELFLLRVKLTNKSTDRTFHPVDAAFNRQKQNEDSSPLYNRLSLGTSLFPGGLFPWSGKDLAGRKEYLEDQATDSVPLGPGESREYSIPSTIVSRIGELLRDQSGANGLWRLQFRTGAIEVPQGNGSREVAVTSVIGVEFRAADVQVRR